jgi:hypothetical protein
MRREYELFIVGDRDDSASDAEREVEKTSRNAAQTVAAEHPQISLNCQRPIDSSSTVVGCRQPVKVALCHCAMYPRHPPVALSRIASSVTADSACAHWSDSRPVTACSIGLVTTAGWRGPHLTEKP